MATFAELWPGAESAGPNDPAPLLVLADWCDENGKPDLAYAFRWCAAHKRRPHRRNDVVKCPWQFIRAQKTYSGRLSSRRVANRRDACFVKQLGAYTWLAEALAALRKVVEMPTVVLPPPVAVVRLGPVTCAMCGIMRDRDVAECFVCKSTEVKA